MPLLQLEKYLKYVFVVFFQHLILVLLYPEHSSPSTPNSSVEILTSHVRVLGGGPLG